MATDARVVELLQIYGEQISALQFKTTAAQLVSALLVVELDKRDPGRRFLEQLSPALLGFAEATGDKDTTEFTKAVEEILRFAETMSSSAPGAPRQGRE